MSPSFPVCLSVFLIDSLGMVAVFSALKAHSSPIQWMWSLELQQTVLNHAKLVHPPCAASKTPINMHALAGRHTHTHADRHAEKHTSVQASFFVCLFILIFLCVPGMDVPELERRAKPWVMVSMTHFFYYDSHIPAHTNRQKHTCTLKIIVNNMP